MNLLLGHDDLVADWVKLTTGKSFYPPFSTIGVVGPDGDFSGAFVFTGYNGDSIELSLAGRGVVNRGAWRAVIAYVFEQMKCSRLQMHTSMRNKKVRRNLAELFPKKEFPKAFEGIARRFYGRDDAVCFALTVDDLPAFRARWRI